MGSTLKNFYVLINCILLWGLLNTEYLAETKNSIINLFCIENFKEEMLKANIDYDVEIAKDTCECYLREFSKSASHQKAIDKCKLETKKKFNLK